MCCVACVICVLVSVGNACSSVHVWGKDRDIRYLYDPSLFFSDRVFDESLSSLIRLGWAG